MWGCDGCGKRCMGSSSQTGVAPQHRCYEHNALQETAVNATACRTKKGLSTSISTPMASQSVRRLFHFTQKRQQTVCPFGCARQDEQPASKSLFYAL